MSRLRRGLACLVAFLLPAAASAQNTVISGVVRSETQAAVRGAFVQITSLSLSTVTNDQGFYRLTVPSDRATGQVTLSISSIGYRPTEVQVTLRPGNITQDITIAEQAISLDEVLVTGTAGRQERRAQAAVVSTISAEAVREVAPVASVANLLQARTPGVVLRNRAGSSGTASQIRIRGSSSIILSNEPLVFIDGIRAQSGDRQIYGVGNQEGTALNDIKIEDIESIEIVKGPAAATLYGSDANAGVINIITKRGRTGTGGFTQSITAEYGEADPNFTPPDNYARCTAANTTSASFPACHGVAPGTVLIDNPLAREGSFRDGRYRNLTWTLSGGGDRYGVFLSFGADEDDGTLPANEYGHLNSRANFDFIASEQLRMEFGFGLSRVRTQLPQNDNNIYGYLGGGFLGDPRTRGAAKDGWYGNSRQTQAINSVENVDKTLRVQPRVSATYTPFQWFSNRLTVGGDLVRTSAYAFWARNDQGWWDDAPRNTGRIDEGRQQIDRVTFDYAGNIARNIGDDIRGVLTFGSQVLTRRQDLTFAQGTGLINNDVRTVNAAAQLTNGGHNVAEDRQIGFFSQLDLAWRERIYLQVGGRRDQVSSFGAESKPFFSPKVGVSYVISDEEFFRNAFGEGGLFSALRLRAAYGATGRHPTSGARTIYNPTTNQISPTAVAVGVVPGTQDGNTGNSELRAERGKELELGFEAGLLNDRLGLDFTFFHKKTIDQILPQPLAPSLGVADPFVNVGETLNRGIELAANARVLTYDRLALDIRASLNTLHNELLDLGGIPETCGAATCRKPGFPLDGVWDYAIKEVDLVNNRVIVSDTLEFIGNHPNLPGWETTASGTLTLFQNLSFYAQMDGRGDRIVFNSTDQFRDRQNGFTAANVLGAEAFGTDADGNPTDAARTKHLRRFGPWVTTEGRTLSRTTVRGDYNDDGTFFKLREASVSYRIPRSFVQRYMKAQQAQLTLSMRNIKTWTDYWGLDPETDQFLTVPQDKRWIARFNFTF